MEKFIWLMFGINFVSIILRLASLATDNYPRILEYERYEDVIQIVISFWLVIWAWSVLHS